MPDVTATLKQILIDQQRRIIDGQETVRRLLYEVKRQVLAELATAPADSFGAYRLQQTLSAIDAYLAGFEQSARATIGAAITDAWDAGQTLLPQLATAAGLRVNTYWLSSNLLDSLKEFAWGKITAVKNDTAAAIRAELSLGVLGQKTPQEVAAAIAGSLERPGVFASVTARAEVITKTEMGRAFSMANQKSLEAAQETIPELQKMWLHAGHPKRARIYHLRLHGYTLPVREKFLVGNIAMQYPRDPTAPASEVINCGCTHVGWLPEFGTKKAFLKTWSDAQKEANKPKGPYRKETTP